MPSRNQCLRLVLGVVSLTAATVACGPDDNLAARQAVVAEAGADVMPFDLDATTHVFTDTPTGGRQDVMADDPNDRASVRQVRSHLAEEADKFRVGDFSDPEAIHGPEMPGLRTLQQRFDDIGIEVIDTDGGAAIVYTTDDPDLVETIHVWFAAQSSDHGSHAEHNM